LQEPGEQLQRGRQKNCENATVPEAEPASSLATAIAPV
jgi:hypothetical protein